MSRPLILICCIFLVAAGDKGRTPNLPPDQFVIGRNTFFDVGPPFNYFEVISVVPDGNATRISRILITPAGDTCTQSPQMEIKEVAVSQSVSELLAGNNPCSIPDRELHREQKRCKHCLTFSGADVVMRLQCNGVARHLRMDILDRDIYDHAHANTPAQTSWTMRLLARLDAALGPGAMQKPIFALGDPISPPSPQNALLRELAAGQFNDLFPHTTFTLSDVYKQAMNPPPQPSVQIVSADPMPTSSEPPQYPPIARAAHVSGRVRFTAIVGTDGHPTRIQIEGHPLLKKSVEAAVSSWTYKDENAGTSLSGAIEFRNNCTSQSIP